MLGNYNINPCSLRFVFSTVKNTTETLGSKYGNAEQKVYWKMN